MTTTDARTFDAATRVLATAAADPQHYTDAEANYAAWLVGRGGGTVPAFADPVAQRLAEMAAAFGAHRDNDGIALLEAATADEDRYATYVMPLIHACYLAGDRIPDRIARLVYLDAVLPVDGESLLGSHKRSSFDLEKMTKDGFVVPNWVPPGKPFPIDVPQPLKTFTDPISLKNQAAAAKIPATYILTVDPGKKPEDDDFFSASERARARGWPVIIMTADHNPQWRQPEAVVKLLLELH